MKYNTEHKSSTCILYLDFLSAMMLSDLIVIISLPLTCTVITLLFLLCIIVISLSNVKTCNNES